MPVLALVVAVYAWPVCAFAQLAQVSTAQASATASAAPASPTAIASPPPAISVAPVPSASSSTATPERPPVAAPGPASGEPALPGLPLQSSPGAAAEPAAPHGFATEFPKYSDRKDANTISTKKTSVSPRFLAAMLDVGLPDGAVLGIALRPTFWTRFQVGAGTNAISPGVRAGAVLVPFGEGPSLTIEGGSYFEGDANSVVSQFAGPGYSNSRTAQRVGYQFANFHAGLDFGSRYTTFFLHGGMTYLHTTLHNANDVLGSHSVNAQGEVTTYTFNQDMNLHVWFPSFKLGFIVYIV